MTALQESALIHSKFDRYSSHYDFHAQIQHHAARALIERIDIASPRRILEIGCGTGILSQMLMETFPTARITFSDVSPNMIELAAQKLGRDERIDFQCLNAETLSPPCSYDLIVANMVVHWFAELPQTLLKIQNALTAQGRFYYSTIGADCFCEWQNSLRQLDLPIGLRLPEGLFGVQSEEHLPIPYPSARVFLHSLKATGAQSPCQGYRPLPPRTLQKAMKMLDEGGPPTLTWHILYGCLDGS